jgi:hypothetical protein
MKSRWRILSFVGLSCSALCMLGLPLLALLASSMGLRWSPGDGLMRVMVVMFLGMYGMGTLVARRHHHRIAPLWLAVLGVALLLLTVWHAVPHTTGWLALALLTVSWCWDWGLLRGCHESRTHDS